MKSEKEKMLNGENYNAYDEILVKERASARRAVREFNDISEDEQEKREKKIREIFGKAGKNVYVESHFKCDYGYNISVGDNFYANFDCVFLDVCSIEIGDNCFVAPGVHIYTATHPLDAAERTSGIESAKPVKIGDNVWLGGRTVVNPGVTIGNNVVIASGSVVVKDIPDNVLAAGCPAKIIKKI